MIHGQVPAVTATGVIPVALGDRRYDIIVGGGLMGRLGTLIAPLIRQRRVPVITDDKVGPLYLPAVTAALAEAGLSVDPVVLPAGEGSKDFAQVQALCDRLLDSRIERATVLMALGGGVIGDLTGFVAGILLRGINFIQVPTTLLAQVDSSVGGKTGVNTRHGKNLVGVFHQPRLVVADVSTLASLDGREMRCGYAEVVKYGIISDAAFFAWLETNGNAILAGDEAATVEAVMTSCRAKAVIVAADEREAGVRGLLNFGHTFGHALEADAGYGDDVLHGEGVAVGMVLACELSCRLGFCSPEVGARVSRHLPATGMPARIGDLRRRPTSADALLERMAQDKKVAGGRLTFILVRELGDAFIARDISADVVRGVLADALNDRVVARP